MLINIDQINELFKLVAEKKAIYLKGNIPSQKNSKQILRKYTKQCIVCETYVIKKGKINYCPKCKIATKLKTLPFIASSKLVLKYKDENQGQYLQNKIIFKNIVKDYAKPLIIGYFLIRQDKRKFDYSNTVEVWQDIFSKLKYWEDDDSSNVITIPLGHIVDKDRAGVIIIPLRENPVIKLI